MGLCTVTVEYSGDTHTVQCEPGTKLLSALGKKDREHIDTPCGGKGVCGKCLIQVKKDGLSALSETEEKKLSKGEIERGYRLACVAEVTGDTTVSLNPPAAHTEILETGIDYTGHFAPCMRKQYITMKRPELEDQRDDFTRLKDTLGISGYTMDLKSLSGLPEILRDNDFSVTAVYNDDEIIAVEADNTEWENYGIAVDIGTTTVVAYLLDLAKGHKIGAASALNVQKAYGQDVISRINHTITDPDGLETLRSGIISQLNELIGKLSDTHHVSRSKMYSISLVGNTTMMHLALGLPPKHIATVPFIPAALEEMRLSARDIGIGIAENGLAYILPGISGYIGADITAAALASGMTEDKKLALLIDIGTNGEIMLGNRDRLVSCSTAAGPAFEGATIRDGVGGISGAVDSVSLKAGNLEYTTIGGEKPVGICGSGIVDIISTMLYAGIIDETGRMLPPEELTGETAKLLSSRYILENDQAAYVIADAEDTSHGDPILLIQKDVREIQNAKASIAAGITTLIKFIGKQIEDVDVVYLAGGFGSYIDKHHAVNIGLLPKELEKKIQVIGNAAGSGAMVSLLSKEKFRQCREIAHKTTYVELSSSPEFMDDYVNNMMF